jgi:exocyst complex protein 7
MLGLLSVEQTVQPSRQYVFSVRCVNLVLTIMKARLAETGAKKIAHLFTTLVAEACSSALLEPMQYLGTSPSSLPLIPGDLQNSLAPVVDALRSLPLPPTHPSHPASSGNLNTLNEAQDGYASMRGAWSKRCLEMRSKDLIKGADSEIDGIQISLDFAQWTAGLLLLAEVGTWPVYIDSY